MLADCFPWWRELAIASSERYAALTAEIEALDPTILGLNEVTMTGLATLLASPHIRANYDVTELPSCPNRSIRTHGCALFSKIPFTECYVVGPGPMSTARPAVVGVFSIGGARVAVCAVHTTAHQTAKNRAIRAHEIGQVNLFLRARAPAGGHFIIGDLNLHTLSEDAVVNDNALLDLWAETHFSSGGGDGGDGDGDPGYTFDPHTNSMVKRYIPAEARRMRLDRILCSTGTTLRPTTPVRLWADTAVDARRQIFLSDHYGLVVDLVCTPSIAPFGGNPTVALALEANGRVPDGPPPFSRVRFAAALVGHLPWLVLRAVGWW
jgi:endonuclease/exonuclease/phosphatase family metal-dependent hydrolase